MLVIQWLFLPLTWPLDKDIGIGNLSGSSRRKPNQYQLYPLLFFVFGLLGFLLNSASLMMIGRIVRTQDKRFSILTNCLEIRLLSLTFHIPPPIPSILYLQKTVARPKSL